MSVERLPLLRPNIGKGCVVLEEKKTNGKGFGLNRLFGKRQTEQNNESVQQEENAAEQAAKREAEAAAEKVAEALREARLTDLRDDMAAVWKYWRPDMPVPELSLVVGESAANLIANSAGLHRERLLLNVRLKQDCRKRAEELTKTCERREQLEEQMRKQREQTEADGQTAPETETQTEEQKLEQELKQLLEGGNYVSLAPACRVYLSSEKMYAWFCMFPPFCQDDVSTEEYQRLLMTALSEAGVTTGLNANDVFRILTEKPYCELICIAAGTPAVEGTDGTVIEHYERERKYEAAVDEQGNVDYYSTNFVCSVKVGDVICDIVPPVEGSPGVRLDGSDMPPKPVKAAKVTPGKNTRISEDGLHLVATKEGNLKFSDGRFLVSDVLELWGDVDYATGNIDFAGDVHVRGGVRENFAVRAAGNVRIDGLVEAATIEAGGDLTIGQGVVGNGQAVLRCGGNLQAKYLESVEAHSKKNISAECIINSKVFSEDSVIVTRGRGVIIGGSVSAAHLIKASVIGAQSDRLTELTLGECSHIMEQLAQVEAQLSEVTTECSELEKKLHQLVRKVEMMGGDPQALAGNPVFAQAKQRQNELETSVKALETQKAELEAQKPDIFQCRLEGGKIYPVTTLHLNNAVWTADEEKKGCVVTYDKEDRELKEKYGCMSHY